ncbi:MAG: 30S ribosomal protein S20, partial [Chlamydiia bacterium]|nr:30S ribosomal protein S20 [Chlamydiia bacterium]
RVQNREFKSRVRTAIRRFEESLKSADKAQIESTLSAVYGLLDRAVKNNVFKLNKSSRLKSRLTARAHATA